MGSGFDATPALAGGMPFTFIGRNALPFLVAVAFALVHGLAVMGLECAPRFGALRLEFGQGLGGGDAGLWLGLAGSAVFARRNREASGHHSGDGETGQ